MYGGGYAWPGYAGYAPYYMAPAPRRAPGETYALVIAWIVTVASGLAIAGGLLVTAIASLGAFTGSGDDLSFLGGIIGFSLAPIVGGGFGLWYGINGIRRKPSPRFRLPAAWFILVLTVLAIGGGVALWQFNYIEARAPGTAFGVLPLALLTGALPALTILAFASQRLGNPSTRRHVWMSVFYGMTLAPLLAVILELIASVIIVNLFHLSAQDAQSVLGQPNTSSPSPTLVIAELLVLSVVAPVVEEGVKPLAALLAIRRLRTPGEAFLVGLAAGVGFDILETIGYIGQGQADWVSVSIDRIGAGLLHGVGAGMGALAWYYLINGAGVRLRWLRAIGCGLYAIVQHSIFNALGFFQLALPDSVNAWLNQPFFLGALPIEHIDVIYLLAYALILGVLIVVTSRLRRAPGMPDRKTPVAQPGAWQVWPAAPYGYPAPYAPATPVAPVASVAPIQPLQQPMGGAR
jgi:RsiW-degrading membrane proteinase PrsW (M82 family)